jgi:hypothetical protein
MKRTRLYWQSTLIVAFAAVGTLFAAQMGDALKIPGDSSIGTLSTPRS